MDNQVAKLLGGNLNVTESLTTEAMEQQLKEILGGKKLNNNNLNKTKGYDNYIKLIELVKKYPKKKILKNYRYDN